MSTTISAKMAETRDSLEIWNSSTVNASIINGSYGLNGTHFEGYESPTSSWAWWLLQIGTPLIMIVGVVGNILSFIVLKSKRFSTKSYSHYLCTLAIFDSLVLIGKYIRRVDSLIHAVGGTSLMDNYGDAACKIHNFTEHVCYLMSSWLVLCMTLERFIAVLFPFKKDMFCRPKNALTIILVAFAIMSYSQIFRLIIIERLGHACTAPQRYIHVYVAMHIYLYQLVLQFMLPAVLILICNLAILYKIKTMRYNIARHGNAHSINAYSKRHKTTCMLLLISFTYIVSLFPLVMLSLIMHVAMSVDRSYAMYLFTKLDDARQIFELISELNYGCNFYIYVLSGAQFRYQLRYLCSRHYSFVSSPFPTEGRVYQFRKSVSS